MKLEGAGLRVDEGWIAEETGYPVSRALESAPEKSVGVAGIARGRAVGLALEKGDIGAKTTHPPLKSISGPNLNNREKAKDEGAEEAAHRPDTQALLDDLSTSLESAFTDWSGEEAADQKILNNCGNGPVGFSPGNKCAAGKGASREGVTKSRTDQFGALPTKVKALTSDQNESRARKAISFAMVGDGRDAPRAVIRDELGEVDFPYGQPGTPTKKYSDGYGLSHIDAKHPGALKRLPEVMGKGDIYEHDTDPKSRRYAVHGNDIAIVKRKGTGRTKGWLVSSFDENSPKIETIKKNSKRVVGRYIPD